MAKVPDRRGSRSLRNRGGNSASITEMLDKAVLVVVSVAAVLIVLKIVGFIAGTVFFVVKLVVLSAVVFVALRLFLRKR